MRVNDALTDEDLADGYVLTCQSLACTPEVWASSTSELPALRGSAEACQAVLRERDQSQVKAAGYTVQANVVAAGALHEHLGVG